MYKRQFVTRFSYEGTRGLRYGVYRAELSPWLWFLTRTADCRIFQNKKVPDIIKEIFREQGFTDFKDALGGSYREWEYCVQYRETDFNFVSRLMEQEGMYYYFTHENGKNFLVLSDGIGSHDVFSNYETVPYFPPDAHDPVSYTHLDVYKRQCEGVGIRKSSFALPIATAPPTRLADRPMTEAEPIARRCAGDAPIPA